MKNCSLRHLLLAHCSPDASTGLAAVRFGPPPPRYGDGLCSRSRLCLDRWLLGLARQPLVLGQWPLDAPPPTRFRLGARLLVRVQPPLAIPPRLLALNNCLQAPARFAGAIPPLQTPPVALYTPNHQTAPCQR